MKSRWLKLSLALAACLLCAGSVPLAAPTITRAVRALQDVPPAPTGLYAKRLEAPVDSARYVVGWDTAADSLHVAQAVVLYQFGADSSITHTTTATADTLTLALPAPGAADTIQVSVRWIDAAGVSSDWTTAGAAVLLAGRPLTLDDVRARLVTARGFLRGSETVYSDALRMLDSVRTARPAPAPETPATLVRTQAATRVDTVQVGDSTQLCLLQVWSDSSLTLIPDQRADLACRLELQRALDARAGR